MLKLNVGLTKKVGEPNYGSRGASVYLELEIESTLVGDPDRLKEKIRQLFALARASVTEELTGANGHDNQPCVDTPSEVPANGNGNSAGHGTNSQRSGGRRPATPSQVRAIHAIARNRHIDLSQFLNARFHDPRPDHLDLHAASQVIDALRADVVSQPM